MNSEGFKILSDTINHTTLIEVGLISASIALYETIVKQPTKSVKIFIRVSWILFSISILAGLFAGHHISFYVINNGNHDLKQSNIGLISYFHFIFFLLGIISIIVFGWVCMKEPVKKDYIVNVQIAIISNSENVMHQFDIWLRNYGKVFLNTISLQKLKDLFLEDFNKLVLERKLWNIDVEGKVYGWCSFYPIISSIDNVKITNIYYYLDFEIEHIESKLDAIKRKVNEVIDSPQ